MENSIFWPPFGMYLFHIDGENVCLADLKDGIGEDKVCVRKVKYISLVLAAYKIPHRRQTPVADLSQFRQRHIVTDTPTLPSGTSGC